jgi:hypothetical protein
MMAHMSLVINYKILRVYDEDTDIWWFSVIDILQVLTRQLDSSGKFFSGLIPRRELSE